MGMMAKAGFTEMLERSNDMVDVMLRFPNTLRYKIRLITHFSPSQVYGQKIYATWSKCNLCETLRGKGAFCKI